MEYTSSMIGGALLIFAVPFLFFILKLKPNNNKSKDEGLKSPPEAGGWRPLVGHLHLLSGTSHAELPHFKLASVADKLGPIFTIRLGLNRVLVVSSWEIIRELCTTHDVAISDRPRFRAFKHMSYDFAMFSSAPYGPYWRETRKLMSMKVLSSQRLEVMGHLTMSEIKESVKDLYKVWKDGGSSGRVLVDMKHWFAHLNLNVIVKMVVGKRLYDGGPHAEEGKRQRQAMRDWFHYMGVFVPGDALPYLAWLDIGGHEKKMKEIAKKLDVIMDVWLEEHKAANKGSKNKQYQDFMDVLLEELARGTLQADDYDRDIVVKATCLVLIAGATDTTAVMLEWTLSLILNHRRVLRRLQEELDRVVGKERQVKESDISSLTYLQAVVKEAFRLYPGGPLGGLRQFNKDVAVASYHVPKGTWLVMNVWKLQRDPKVWGEDASEFNPERFLGGAHKNVNVLGQHFELIPFGAGRRICPGSNFGVQMLHQVFANVLHAFDFATVADQPIDMTESAGMTNSKATPLDVLVSPRLSPNLYR